jgi:mediator of RNA polymerase II transcription subunit 17
MTATTTPFTVRPWPRGDKKPKNLAEFIARVNIEKKGFRNVTEESLREEIAEQQRTQGGEEEKDAECEEGADGAGVDDKDIRVVREQMLRDVEWVWLQSLSSARQD